MHLAAADIVLVDGQDGTTSLRGAVSNNHCEVAQILIAAKADVNDTNNVTPLPWARTLAATDMVLVDGQGKETALKRESGKVGFQPNYEHFECEHFEHESLS